MKQELMRSWFKNITLSAALLAFIVVVLGAFVRLTDAGLGCPDWPGCYGLLTAPEVGSQTADIMHTESGVAKAWNEMIHRYVAGILGLLVLALTVIAVLNRRDPEQPVAVPVALLALVIFQALLGMWTVTMLLRPEIVTLHLLMGMATLAILWWLWFRTAGERSLLSYSDKSKSTGYWAFAALTLVYLQIALGGWVSTNYAALHCPDFPTCQEQWWPQTDFAGAFDLNHGDDSNFEGGKLTNTQGVTVHITHRIGALILLVFFSIMVWIAQIKNDHRFKQASRAIAFLLLIQIGLGISNVLFLLPLPVAVAHNGVAALLLIASVYLNHVANPRKLN
ncbi:COX15/CtaA family protein [Solemya velum gill symbiont]|nr:COX15/CtaA family protein [Solemya velum gill symbiont]